VIPDHQLIPVTAVRVVVRIAIAVIIVAAVSIKASTKATTLETTFSDTTATSPFEGEATLNDAQASDLMAGKWYINIHTAANKGGEIRGQVTK
jgi:hypothetical protein